MRKLISESVITIATLLLMANAPAQQADPRLLSYPELLIINGKVVSMEDTGLNESIGKTYEALAVRNGRILDLGTTADIRRLGGRVRIDGHAISPAACGCFANPG